jgi:hypothetical protein
MMDRASKRYNMKNRETAKSTVGDSKTLAIPEKSQKTEVGRVSAPIGIFAGFGVLANGQLILVYLA